MFRALFGTRAPMTSTTNAHGAPAYAMSPRHALAQLAVTGCFNGTFYATGKSQLDAVLDLCIRVNDPAYVARVAVYAREKAHMKDVPAFLTAMLATMPDGGPYLMAVFDRVIDSPKMLANFVQVVRSGVTGRKSLGSRPKRLIESWLSARTDEALFRGSVGVASPSLADVIRMVHPRPTSASRKALYGYLSGRNRPEHAFDVSQLPDLVQHYEAFKRAPGTTEMPEVPFQMLTSLSLTRAQWRAIAANGSWQMVRQNLNTFVRHGVFEDAEMTERIAARLRSATEIARARVLPYQLLAAYRHASPELPGVVREALHDAMELAVANVPALEGNVVVCLDVSGSMSMAITGARPGATSVMRCIDVAALVAAAVLRKSPNARILPFEQGVVPVDKLQLTPRDTVMTNAQKLAGIGGGGTNCSAPLSQLNGERAAVDLVIYVSDNESWVDRNAGVGTSVMVEWLKLKERCPHARMVCIDLVPNATTQAQERPDALNVGGFSDEVFSFLGAVARGETTADHWVKVIDEVKLGVN